MYKIRAAHYDSARAVQPQLGHRSPLAPGERVGPYEVVATIGAGGMGIVYRARDTKLNRDVALKVLPKAFAGDADRLSRLRRGAQALAALNHPNIAQIYGIEDAPGAPPALVMELVSGTTLDELIAARRAATKGEGGLPLDDVLKDPGSLLA